MLNHSLLLQPTAVSVAGVMSVSKDLTEPHLPNEDTQMNHLIANSAREAYRCLPPQVDTHEERPPCPYCGLDCCSCNPYGNDNELLVQPNLDPDSTTFAKGKARMAVQPNTLGSEPICPNCGCEYCRCNPNYPRSA
jgi:hypothetical protein